jgi:hypothetical protein
MKLTKWGGRSFDKPQTAYVAVVVLACVEGKLQYRWVTDIFYQGRKEWVAENHKKAYLFEKKHAEEFVMALAWNGTAAWTVTVFPDSVPENNW